MSKTMMAPAFLGWDVSGQTLQTLGLTPALVPKEAESESKSELHFGSCFLHQVITTEKIKIFCPCFFLNLPMLPEQNRKEI